MKRGIVALVMLAPLMFVFAACDNFGDDRMAALEREVRALRAAHTAAPPDVAAAMAPLRGAVDLLVQRGDVERARFAAVAQEVTQLATLMHGVVDAGRRAEVEALRGRVLDLDRQIKEQNQAQGEEREILLKALDLTATKLESFLRQVGAQKVDLQPAQEPKVRRSWQDPALLWGSGLGLLGLLSVLLWLRRAQHARVIALDMPIEPVVVVDSPEPVAHISRGAWSPQRGPVPVHAAIGTKDACHAREELTRFLATEPRVLQVPAPQFEVRGPLLHVQFFVHDELPLAERASLQADVQLRGLAESTPGRRSA